MAGCKPWNGLKEEPFKSTVLPNDTFEQLKKIFQLYAAGDIKKSRSQKGIKSRDVKKYIVCSSNLSTYNGHRKFIH